MFGADSARLVELSLAADLPEPGSIHALDRGANHSISFAAVADGADADHALCGVVRQEDGRSDVLALLRKGTAFDASDRARLAALLPHVCAAWALARKLASEDVGSPAASYLARLLPMPCLLTDETGRCIEHNDAFDRLLPALSGALSGDRVGFTEPSVQEAWQHALAQAHATGSRCSLVVRAASGDDWKVQVVPFARGGRPAHPAPGNLIIATFDKLPVTAPTLSTSFSHRLTKAELEVLQNLLLGQTAKVIARARGASVNTVRSQITSILNKTGQRTQKQLIASIHQASESASTSYRP